MARTYVFRLTAEGVKELERDLKSMADNSGQSLDALKAKFPGLSSVIDDANRKLDEHRRRQGANAASAGLLSGSLDRVNLSAAALIGRYASCTAVMVTANRLAHDGAERSDGLKSALDRQTEAWNRLADAAAPALTFIYDRLADIMGLASKLPEALNAAGSALRNPMTAEQFMRRDSASPIVRRGNLPLLAPDAGYLPDEIEVTPALKSGLDTPEKMLADQRRAIDEEAEQIYRLSQARAKMWEENRVAQDKAHAAFMSNLDSEIKRLSGASLDFEKQRADNEKFFADAKRTAIERDIQEHYRIEQEAREDRKRDEAAFNDWVVSEGVDSFLRLVQGGKGAWRGMLDDMMSNWAYALQSMARQGKLFGQDGMFGGGAFGGKPGQVGWVGGALSGAALLAGALQDPNGNTRISSGLGGAASGALYGSAFGPIGTAVGAIVGGIAGLVGGSDKPSNFRAGADFGSGMGSFAISGDKPNENTLGLAQQAAAAIMQEVASLKQFGVEFQQQLANVWIGQRDESTYQFAGGQRISVGSVGNAGDLAQDTLQALLKGATSSDPMIASVLKSGAPDLLKALQFAQGITDALEQITDPLQSALDLWKRQTDANLEMAKASGVNLDIVRQLAAEQRKGIMEQYYGPTQSSLTGFIQNLQFGPGSTASPEQQYSGAFSAYDAAKSAALKDASPETVVAFLGQANTFLPIARNYWASSQPYGAIEQGALNTAQQLQGMITSMMSGADSTVMAITSTGAAQVEAIEGVSAGVERLNARMDRLAGMIEAVMARVV